MEHYGKDEINRLHNAHGEHANIQMIHTEHQKESCTTYFKLNCNRVVARMYPPRPPQCMSVLSISICFIRKHHYSFLIVIEHATVYHLAHCQYVSSFVCVPPESSSHLYFNIILSIKCEHHFLSKQCLFAL